MRLSGKKQKLLPVSLNILAESPPWWADCSQLYASRCFPLKCSWVWIRLNKKLRLRTTDVIKSTLSFFDFLFLLKFILDPCSSSPCLHGNCSRTYIVKDTEPSYVCECAKGYKGKRCDQVFPNLLAVKLELANPSPPEPETPATSSTSATTQPIPIASTTPPPLPTLLPWQPKPGQKLQVVQWETSRVRHAR